MRQVHHLNHMVLAHCKCGYVQPIAQFNVCTHPHVRITKSRKLPLCKIVETTSEWEIGTLTFKIKCTPESHAVGARIKNIAMCTPHPTSRRSDVIGIAFLAETCCVSQIGTCSVFGERRVRHGVQNADDINPGTS